MFADIDFKDGMDFGIGIDDMTLNPRGNAVVAAELVTADLGEPQIIQTDLTTLDTYDEYQHSFDFTEQVSVSYGLFGGSEKFSFAENHRYNSYTKYVMAKVNVTNAFKKIKTPRFDPDAEKMLINDNKNFRKVFGDSFVIGIKTGGTYYALLEFEAKSQEDFQNMSGRIDANYGLFISGNASFNDTIQQISKESSFTFSSFQVGGEDTSQPLNAEQLIEKTKTFASDVKKVAKAFTAVIQDHSTIPVQGANPVDIFNQRETLLNYYRKAAIITQRLNDVDQVLFHPEAFEKFDQNLINSIRSGLLKLLNDLKDNASRCANNIFDCKFESTDPIPAVDLPSLKGPVPPPPDLNQPVLSTPPILFNGQFVSIVKDSSGLSKDVFAPMQVNLHLNQLVAWKNKDILIHTITSGEGPNDPNQGKEFDSGSLLPKSIEHGGFIKKFTKTGQFKYFCKLHHDKIGTVMVS